MAQVAAGLAIVNTDRSVCRFGLAGEIAGRHGNTVFVWAASNSTSRVVAGQSFGCPAAGGMNVRLGGRCQRLRRQSHECAGRMSCVPPAGCVNPGAQVILGNTCLYGRPPAALLFALAAR